MTTTPFLDADGRPLRRPVVYLDTSTLGDAFPGAREPTPALTEVVELAASRGTLCLSIAHANEIAAIPERERAFAIARWLCSLDHAWIAVTSAEQDELAHALSAELGLTTDPARLPGYRTMMGGLRDNLATLTPSGSSQLLRDPTIAGLVWECHGRIDWERPKVFSVDQFKKLHFDRGNLPPGMTPDRVRD